MLKLKRLTIERYRNVLPGTELRFDDGLNLIMGQNASGKTTLLDLLSAVCRSAFEGIAHEEFVLDYEIRSERFVVSASVSHLRVHSGDGGEIFGAGPRWVDSYEVVIDDCVADEQLTIRSRGSAPHTSSTSLGVEGSVVSSSIDLIMGWSFIAATLSGRGGDWAVLRNELITTFASTFRFDESLGCFSAMTGRSASLVGAAVVPVARAGLVEQRDTRGGTSTTTGAFVPVVLAHALHRSFRSSTSSSKRVDLGGDERAMMVEFARMLGVEDVSITPNLLEHRVTESSRSFQVEGFTFEITRADGTVVHHDRLSYGQKRLLAFCYYLECNPLAVIADELVNGLHHRWIDASMTALEKRQAFLTSQNPLLFDYVEFDSIERVRSSFITCTLEVVDGREQMVWRNMSEQEARIFFDAYEVGIEHVGDILITRGLW